MSAIKLGDENLEKAVFHIEMLGSKLAEAVSEYEMHS